MKLTIPITPKAQMRARSRAVRAKDGRMIAMTYKDKKQADNEETLKGYLIALLFQNKLKPVREGPVLLGVKAYVPIPRSMPKYKRALALEGKLRPTTKPDLDNLIKHLKDCANEILWSDDKQVVGYLDGTGKYYDDGQGSRWEVEIVAVQERRMEGKI